MVLKGEELPQVLMPCSLGEGYNCVCLQWLNATFFYLTALWDGFGKAILDDYRWYLKEHWQSYHDVIHTLTGFADGFLTFITIHRIVMALKHKYNILQRVSIFILTNAMGMYFCGLTLISCINHHQIMSNYPNVKIWQIHKVYTLPNAENVPLSTQTIIISRTLS